MRVWLIQIGEPLPIDGKNVRLHRTGILANYLVESGHEVVWWASTFDHFNKKQRYNKDTVIDLRDGCKLILLHSFRYKKNLSISRLINHFFIARRFKRLAKREAAPDIIVSSFPSINLSYEAVQYGNARKIPVVIDARDMWPDIFLDLVPKRIRCIERPLLLPAHRKTRGAFRDADAIIGITAEYVSWGLTYAGRGKTALDRDFPFGYPYKIPDNRDIEKADEFWSQYGISKVGKEFIVCFFGAVGRHFDFDTVLEAANSLDEMGLPFRFVICGSGDKLDHYRGVAERHTNVLFPGWISQAEIWTLMRVASVGLAPYHNVENFTRNLPNKIIEYLSSGLPVLSSLEGVTAELLQTNGCGVCYENGNPQDLLGKLLYLYKHPAARKKMTEKAHKLFKERFIADKVYSEMIDYLVSVCNSKSGRNEKS